MVMINILPSNFSDRMYPENKYGYPKWWFEKGDHPFKYGNFVVSTLPEKGWLEHYFPTQKAYFQGLC